MDENEVREHAEAHARALTAGDLRRAAQDLTEEGSAAAGPVMKQLPRQIESAEVTGITRRGEEAVASIV